MRGFGRPGFGYQAAESIQVHSREIRPQHIAAGFACDHHIVDPVADPNVPVQENVDDQKEAEPGSGEGITIGYATSLETVPVVHVISEGIKEQAEKAGVELIFCDTGGDVTKALDCANTFKTRGVQGVLQFQHVTEASPSICAAGPQGVPVFAIDIPQPPCQTSFMGVDNAYGGYVAGVKAGETMQGEVQLRVRRLGLARAAGDR